MINKQKVQAREIRTRLLTNGIEIIDQVEKIALHGDPNYNGDIKALNLMVKLISPMISMNDDRRKLTENDKIPITEQVTTLLYAGELSVVEAQEYYKCISGAKIISDMDELMERLEVLEIEND